MKGELEPPKGTNSDNWERRKQLLFKSTDYGDDTDKLLKKMMALGPILRQIWHTI